MWDENSTYPRIETGYAVTEDLNDELVVKFKNGNFTKRSAFLKKKCYNPKKLVVQHLPVKEREKKIENNCMRKRYMLHHLTSVDIQELKENGGKVIEIYEGVFYREKFEVSSFRKVIDKLFALKQKYKDENYDVMQLLVKLLINTLCGEQIRKDIAEGFSCKSEHWMMSEFDERVKDYWRIYNANYIVKMVDDKGLEDVVKKLNTILLYLGCFVLSNSKRIMNNFIHANNGFYTNVSYYEDTDSMFIENENWDKLSYYEDTDSMFIENKHWDKLDKAGLVGKTLLQGKSRWNLQWIVFSS